MHGHVPWDRYRHRGNLPEWEGNDLYDAAFGPPPPLTCRPLPSEWDDPTFAVATIVVGWHERRAEALRAIAEMAAIRRRTQARREAAAAADARREAVAAESARSEAAWTREHGLQGILIALGQHGPLTVRKLARYLGRAGEEVAVGSAVDRLADRGTVRRGRYESDGPVYIRLASARSEAAWTREHGLYQVAAEVHEGTNGEATEPPPPPTTGRPSDRIHRPRRGSDRPLFPRDLAVLAALTDDPMSLAEVAGMSGQPEEDITLVLTGLVSRGLAGTHNDWYWKTMPGDPRPAPAPEPVRVPARAPVRPPREPVPSPPPPPALDQAAAERRLRHRHQPLTPLAWSMLAVVNEDPRSVRALAGAADVSPPVAKRVLERLAELGRVVAVPRGRGCIYRRPVGG